ncbi:P-loop containing nucleoside triphosphate hydrolase protein [Gautieria morchelliformis]|nr:P-loop containing nucleoside triphosphate hydrolase protein [Gautieria morchelliformis]
MLSCPDADGWGPVSRDRDFDFTLCFEEAVLLPTLFGALVLLGFAQALRLTRNPVLPRGKRSCRILKAKLTLLILAASCSLSSLVIASLSHPGRFQWPLPTALLNILAFALTPAFTYLNHTRTRSSASVLILFWPAYILSLLIWLRSIFTANLPSKHDVDVWLVCAAAAFGAVSFMLELMGPELAGDADEYEEIGKVENESPIVRANIYSRWSFGWMTPLMKLGSSKFLTEDDMYTLLPADESATLGARLQSAMERHSSLWVSLFVAYGGPFAFAAFLKVIQDVLAFLQPQLLRILLSYITAYQQSREEGVKGPSPYQGFAIALLMFMAALCQTAILHQYFQRVYETGMRVRAGLVTAIYRKALLLSPDERGDRATGDIVNLMSVDATKMQDLCTYGLIVLSGPLQITLAFISLYNLLGWPAFVGVAIMAISIPAQTIIAKYLKKLQEKQMKNRDQRTRLMSELLANIKSIKLYGWEPAFIRRILRVRNDQELKMMRKIGLFSAYNNALWTFVPLLVAFSSFVVAAATSSKPLTSDVIFPAISLFMLLQFPLAMFASITSSVIEAIVSVNRLSAFLRAGELQPDARKVVYKPDRLKEGETVLEIQGGEFQWRSEEVEPALHGIDLTVKKGELVGVLGRVGAGKTSLLSAIIGEMLKTEGELTLYGTVAYCPQTPWSVLPNPPPLACALRQDLTLLKDGDMTQLSGGQRARVSLARAVYARADLYLLDDVLAAVDSHVARHIFDHVIGPSGILATKARILVTNTVSFLKQHDQLIFLRRGIVLESGTCQDILADESKELHKLMLGHSNILASGTSTPRGDDETLVSSSSSEQETTLDNTLVQGSLGKLQKRRSFGRAALAQVGTILRAPTQPTGTKQEHTERGRVKLTVYSRYIKAASVPGFVLFLVSVIAQQASNVLANVTLKQWGEHNQEMGSNSGMSSYLVLYGLCSIATILSSLTGTILLFVFCTLQAAKYLHNTMLLAVMRAPLSFFEQTPTGRAALLCLTRAFQLDQVLAQVIGSAFRTMAAIGGILVVIGVSFPAFLIAIPFLGYFYFRIMMYYLATGRELKRLDAMSRSPIFTSFSETLAGISTIRAFGQQNIFIVENQRRIDRNQMCYLPAMSVNRWLAVRLETMGASLILITAFLACAALVTTGVNAGLVGLVLSYGLSSTNTFNWFVRSASEVEQNVVSVERILHQADVTPEAPEHIPEAQPEEEWPSKGAVEFKSYSMRYRPDLDLVLKDISLTIKPREKIGICGRTGAGKSSLLLALFRIIEPTSGTIMIDGVDITTLGLNDRMYCLSPIWSGGESQMFEGTMRENVDPTGVHEDANIWTALEQAHLKDFVQSLPGALDAKVQEGGASMSSGQRQLLCFARALLRKSKILVLDEATSAIDLDTDKAVQDILRGPQFTNTTILTIAHRLNTIIEADRVLVLSDGKVAEFDSPKALLENPDSMFASLAKEAGVTLNRPEA